MPEISIIVPAYNVEKYLHRCIDSILAQTFTDFELILVDDGSTDGSGKICDEYIEKDSRVRVIHKENGGVSKARNAGLDIANGEYICFCDSDDYIRNNYLEVLYNSLQDTDSDCVSCSCTLIDNIGNEEEMMSEAGEYVIDDWNSKYVFIKDYALKSKVIWALWARIFKKRIIDNYNIRVCETCENFAEDLYFTLAYYVHCKKTVHIDFFGYYYYQREESMMAKTQADVKLNALNEVSFAFYEFLQTTVPNNIFIKNYPTIHFWIMYNQYQRFWEQTYNRLRDFSTVPDECKKIEKKQWHNKMIKKFLLFSKEPIILYDKDMTFDYKNLCFYMLHRSYKLFGLLEGLYYRLKRKREK